MEPHQDEKTTEPRSQEKKHRFRIERLEERIAPLTSNKIGNWSPGGVGGDECTERGNSGKFKC